MSMLSVAFKIPLSQKPRVPRVLLRKMKDTVLGKRYELSVAFVASAEIRKHNVRLRGQPSPTDILSFPLAQNSGEILFSLTEVKKQARLFHRTPSNFLLFLFIHGLLHLKGYEHGSRMEREEEKIRKEFGI